MKRSPTPKACAAVDQLVTDESPVIRPESDLRLSAPRPPTPVCRLQNHEGVRAERRQWRVARAAVDSASEMFGRQSEPF